MVADGVSIVLSDILLSIFNLSEFVWWFTRVELLIKFCVLYYFEVWLLHKLGKIGVFGYGGFDSLRKYNIKFFIV